MTRRMLGPWGRLIFAVCAAGWAAAAEPPARWELREGDRVVLLGDTLIEREQQSGWIETMLTARFADRAITFRNLGWSADTPAGDSRFGLSLVQAGHEPAGEGWAQLQQQIAAARPTVVVIGYGMAASFAGEAGLEQFRADYRRLLERIAQIAPGVRFLLLGPVAAAGWPPPGPEAAARARNLERYAAAVAALAAERKIPFVALHEAFRARPATPALTDNGIHLLPAGYRAAAEIIEEALWGAPGGWRTSAHIEGLRSAIVQKNQWFFHRSRPANMAYIFGFRKREQGQNAAEVMRFDALIAQEEARIAKLRSLRETVPAPPIPPPRAETITPLPQPQFIVAEGLEVTLWAEDPLLHKPVQMNFDARGRLWVASSRTYPQIEPGQPAADQIVVLEDTQGRGRADKATVFADGLLIPTGLEVGDDGVYVAQSTELLHLRDTDGDGKADVRRTVLSGFGTEDTHHNLHTLRWGPGGQLYMVQSVYTRTDTETPHGVVRLKAGGVFRLDPRTVRLDVVYRGWLNAWGHQFDAFDQPFLTDGAGSRGLSWAIPGATYETLAPARRVLQSVSPGTYPKFCGLELVHSAAFPADWQGDAITCDFRAHRVVRFKLADQGAGYVTTAMPDVLRTTATTFRPIDVRLGPDGALYVADWSNPIIQHGEVDFRDPRRDKVHGRIWRVAVRGSPTRSSRDLTRVANRELFEMLAGPDGYAREQSQRVLIARGAAAVLPELREWTAALPASRELARWRAVQLGAALGQPDTALLTEMLAAGDARVRAAAIRASPPTLPLETLRPLVRDPHPRVRLEAVRALGRIPTVPAADAALAVLDGPMDPFLDYALWLTMNELAEPWLAAVRSGEWKTEGRLPQLEFGLKAVEPAQAGQVLGGLLERHGLPRDGSGPWLELAGAAGGPAELRRVFDAVIHGKLAPAAASRALQALADAARGRDVRPTGDLLAVRELLSQPEPAVRAAALRLAAAWKQPALLADVLRLATNETAPDEARRAAFAALRETGGTEVTAALGRLVESDNPLTRHEAVTALAALDLTAALPHVLRLLQAPASEAEATALWRRLLEIRGASARLARELARVDLPVTVARAGLRPAREGSQHEALAAILVPKAGLKVNAAELSPAELQQHAREAIAQGDPARGERIYRRPELACVACHAIGGVGGKVGPDLTTIGASAPADYILEALLAPGAKVKEGYHAVVLSLRDGRELSGMIVRESGQELVLRDGTNQEVPVAVQTILKRTSVGSLMPAGLVDTLLPEERMDLVAFLSSLGKPGAFDASEPGVARAWKMFARTSRNEHLGMERIVAGDFALPGWEPLLALANGALPADALAAGNRDRGSSRGFFVATQFRAPAAGAVDVKLSPAGVVAAWCNGQPVVLGPQLALPAKDGINTLVLQLDQAHPPTDLKVSGKVIFLSE